MKKKHKSSGMVLKKKKEKEKIFARDTMKILPTSTIKTTYKEHCGEHTC